MTREKTPHPAQPPPGVDTPTPADRRPTAVLVQVAEPPIVVAADLLELRRGGCTVSCDGPVSDGADGILSICRDGEFFSRPVRVGAIGPHNTASLVFSPTPDVDPRWSDLALDGE